MLLLYIWSVISGITFTMSVLTIISAGFELRRRYPNLKYRKRHSAEVLLIWFRMALLCVVPIVHIFVCGVFMLRGEELMEESICKAYEKNKDNNLEGADE